ncbi:hypothetical protein ACIODW_14540 [Streptomyces sp. NPDC087897]|uniref:hypothetical protein n=1 Tax=Streptomyces sp. NPDC087897 TaxID=3365817 RepID=UPI0037FB8ABE
MSYAEKFRAHARQYGVSDDAITRILWHVQPAVGIEGIYDDPGPDDRVVGYAGGLPRMPVDVPWEWGTQFVACLDLAAIPKQPLDDWVTREGHLLLFSASDYWQADDDPLSVVYVPPGAEMVERANPAVFRGDGVEEAVEPFDLLSRKTLILTEPAEWDVLGETWVEEEPAEGETPGDLVLDWQLDPLLVAALEEYRSRVPHPASPGRHESDLKLRGAELNPHGWDTDQGDVLAALREEAVPLVREAPERFEELHLQALTAAIGNGYVPDFCHMEHTEPWLCLAEVAAGAFWRQAEGTLAWMVSYADLRAGRLDRIHSAYHE